VSRCIRDLSVTLRFRRKKTPGFWNFRDFEERERILEISKSRCLLKA